METSKIWFDDNKIFILTDDSQELWQSLLWYPRLQSATEQQRENYRLTPFGIRWDDIDEDISFESFSYPDPEPRNTISDVMRTLPEINISQFARRMGIAQSLFASYITGAKTPSDERRKCIETELHKLGEQLMRITL